MLSLLRQAGQGCGKFAVLRTSTQSCNNVGQVDCSYVELIEISCFVVCFLGVLVHWR